MLLDSKNKLSSAERANTKNAENKNEFEGFLNIEKAEFSKSMYLLSAGLFLVFGLIDIVAISSHANVTIAIRCMAATFLMFGFYVTKSHSKFFLKHYRLFLATSFLLTSSTIQYIINISTPVDFSHTIYFAGLMLIIMSIFAWTFLSVLDAFLISSTIVGMYIFSAVNNNPAPFLQTLIMHSGNILLLSSSAVIGLMSTLSRNKYLRHSFLLQQSLKDAYAKKSIEAKDNQYLANHDPLTDLPNRRYMTELLNNSLEYASDNNKVLVIMFVDLNGFKQINDVYGHNAGDEVLVIAAKRLELAIRQGDNLSRLGGDEYLLGLMMDKENLEEIEVMASKFIDIIAQPMNVEGLRVKVGASIGVAAYPIHGNNIESLIEIADKRMYEAKKLKTSWSFDLESLNDLDQESVVVFPGKSK